MSPQRAAWGTCVWKRKCRVTAAGACVGRGWERVFMVKNATAVCKGMGGPRGYYAK